MRERGYDLEYRRYLRKYNGKYDEFCILIDRDTLSHSEVAMKECIQHCKRKKYNCYIANPCFEFWLLLHLSDVKVEYKERLDELLENKHISAKHTFVSKEVSDKAGHGKKGIRFEKNYLPNVDSAVERARYFASEEVELVGNIGCNLWKLIEKMKSN